MPEIVFCDGQRDQLGGPLLPERLALARGRSAARPARLSESQVRQVRSLRARGESINELVRAFGTGGTVQDDHQRRELRPEPSRR